MSYRCTACNQTAPMPYGDLVIDWVSLTVSRHGVSTAATRRELLTLHNLIERRGQFVPLEELETAAFEGAKRTGNGVAIFIYQLRRLLKPMRVSITSRRGQGYRLVAGKFTLGGKISMEVGDKCPQCGGVVSEHQTITAKTRRVEIQVFRCENRKCGWTSDREKHPPPMES